MLSLFKGTAPGVRPTPHSHSLHLTMGPNRGGGNLFSPFFPSSSSSSSRQQNTHRRDMGERGYCCYICKWWHWNRLRRNLMGENWLNGSGQKGFEIVTRWPRGEFALNGLGLGQVVECAGGRCYYLMSFGIRTNTGTLLGGKQPARV